MHEARTNHNADIFHTHFVAILFGDNLFHKKLEQDKHGFLSQQLQAFDIGHHSLGQLIGGSLHHLHVLRVWHNRKHKIREESFYSV